VSDPVHYGESGHDEGILSWPKISNVPLDGRGGSGASCCSRRSILRAWSRTSSRRSLASRSTMFRCGAPSGADPAP